MGPHELHGGEQMTYRRAAKPALVGALRRLPGLLTRVTVPAMAVGAVCATVLGLLASQLVRMAREAWNLPLGLLRLSTGLGAGVPAALTRGLVVGVAATVS